MINRLRGSALFVLVGVAALSACSSSNVYEGLRHRERDRCLELPDAEREDCLERIRDDYETYERERGTAY